MARPKRNLSIEVKPVAWAGDKVLKYQAFGYCSGKTICGEPLSTTEEAYDSLAAEIDTWVYAANCISRLFAKDYVNNKEKENEK